MITEDMIYGGIIIAMLAASPTCWAIGIAYEKDNSIIKPLKWFGKLLTIIMGVVLLFAGIVCLINYLFSISIK